MANYQLLKADIDKKVYQNGKQEITGENLNSVLNAMVTTLGAGYQFMGVATPTNPGTAQTPDYKCFYLATTPGTYTNLGGLVVADGEVSILKYDSSWTKEVTGIATAEQLNQLGQKLDSDLLIGGVVVVDYSNYPKTLGALSGSTQWNCDQHNRYHKAIPIPLGTKKIGIIANSSQSATFVIAKSYTPPTYTGEQIDVAQGQLITNINAGESIILNNPDDGAYLIVSVNSNSPDMTPYITCFSDKQDDEFFWSYGNINTDGNIITPIAKNRIHSSLISLMNVRKISCDSAQYIGYALYDENKEFLVRWWVDNVSELDVEYISLLYVNAKYISILMMKTNNSDFDLVTENPELNIIKTETPTFVPKTIRLSPQTKLPVIIFNFDDCSLPGDSAVVNLFESRGVTCGFAFIAREQDIAEKANIYKDYQKRGFDIMNHSGGVNSIITSNYTFEQAKELIVANGLERLQKAGFIINGFVCPNSEMSNEFLPIVAKTHAYNMIGTPYGANGRDADVNKLVRYSLENNTTATIKAYIDDCITNDKCLIFYAHTSRFGQTIAGELFDINKVAEILDYCITKRNNLECWVGGTDEGIKYYFDIS